MMNRLVLILVAFFSLTGCGVMEWMVGHTDVIADVGTGLEGVEDKDVSRVGHGILIAGTVIQVLGSIFGRKKHG